MTRALPAETSGGGMVDALLRAGTPVREVARLTGIPRSNLARHREHLEGVGDRRLVEVPGRLKGPTPW